MSDDDDRGKSMPRLRFKPPPGLSMDGNWTTTKCLEGHPLKEFRTFYDGYTCSYCNTAFPRKTTLRGCRKCDYDICKSCDAENAQRSVSLPHARQQPSISTHISNSERKLKRRPSRENIPSQDVFELDKVLDNESTSSPLIQSRSPRYKDDRRNRDGFEKKESLNVPLRMNRRVSDISLFDDGDDDAPENTWVDETHEDHSKHNVCSSSPMLARESVLLTTLNRKSLSSATSSISLTSDNNTLTNSRNIQTSSSLKMSSSMKETVVLSRKINEEDEEDDNIDEDVNLDIHEEDVETISPRKSPIQRRPPSQQTSPTMSPSKQSIQIKNTQTTTTTTTTTSSAGQIQPISPTRLPTRQNNEESMLQSPRRSPIRGASAPRLSSTSSYRVNGSGNGGASMRKKLPPPTRKMSKDHSTISRSSSQDVNIEKGEFMEELDLDHDENVLDKIIKFPHCPLSNQGHVLENITDESLGINKDEMNKAYFDLKLDIEGKQDKPQGMKQLNQGKIGRGGWWTLHGLVDADTGLLQLFLEGHFGVPMSIMERCILDESFQKSYDPFLKIKQVVGYLGFANYHNTHKDDEDNIHSNSNNNKLVPPSVKDLEYISEVLHHEIKFPAPFSNRDYVFYRRRKMEKDRFTYIQRDVQPNQLASQYATARKGVIRAGNGKYWQLGMCTVETLDNERDDEKGVGRCVVIIKSQDNIEGKVPKWLSNLAAKQGAPGYVKQLEKAAVALMVEEGMISKAEAKRLWK